MPRGPDEYSSSSCHRPTDRVTASTSTRPSWQPASGSWFWWSAALAFGLRFFQAETARLRAELAEMEALKQQARLQQEELELMKETAKQVDQELSQIRRLEQDLETMTEGEEVQLPSRSSLRKEHACGRRGARRAGDERAAGPGTESGQHPAGRRQSLCAGQAQHPGDGPEAGAAAPTPWTPAWRAPGRYGPDWPGNSPACGIRPASLADGRDQLAARLDYLAHKPSGWPVHGAEITDGFGPRLEPLRLGLAVPRRHRPGPGLRRAGLRHRRRNGGLRRLAGRRIRQSA